MASRTPFLSFILAIALFTACLQGSAGIDLSLGFIKEPEDVVAKRNQSVILDCSAYSASEYGPLNFTWYHKGVLVNDGRRQILANGSLYIKRVRYRKHGGSNGGSSSSSSSSSSSGGGSSSSGASNGGTESYTGEYRCAITNNLGTLISRPAQLTIASMSRKFLVEPESREVEEGDVVQFRCQIQANPTPTVFWQRLLATDSSSRGHELWTRLPSSDSRLSELPSGTLQISGVYRSDAGRYRCTAQDGEHEYSTVDAKLNVIPATKVYSPPSLLTLPSTVTVKVGEQAILYCFASGYPKPVMSWAKQGPDGQDGPEIRSNLSQGYLMLKNVSVSDEGTYVCTASNEFADMMETKSVTQLVHLKVLVPPTFIERPQSIIGPLGITIRFECKVNGNPEPSVKWFKDGQSLEGSRIKHKVGPYCSSLVILQTIKADSGIYQCVAENTAGYRSVAARLQVNTSQDQPDPPMGLFAKARSSSSIELYWNASVPRNGLATQAYTVHYFLSTGGEETQKVTMNTSYLIENVQPYTNYTFYVRAYNGKSASEQSESVIAATGEDVPSGFPLVTLSSIRSTLSISWEELPSSIARGIVVGYKIHWRLHMHVSTNVVEVSGDVREFTVTGLVTGKKYEARVAACTKFGYPKLSDQDWPWVTHEMARYVSADALLPPELHLTVVNATAIKARWRKPKDDSQEVTGYVLHYHKQNHRLSDPIVVNANVTQYLMSDLVPHTRYEVHIFAYSQKGDGWESVTGIDTLPDKQSDEYPLPKWSVVEPPSQLVARSTNSTAIHLAWKSPLTNKNVSNYTIRFNPVNNSSLVNSSSVTYVRSTNQELVIDGLTPYTQYEFSVRSHDEDNKPGPYSNKVECKTLEAAPTAPLNLHWKLLDPHTIRLMWQPPKYPNGIILNYDIMYNTELDPLFLFDKWYTIKEHGTELSSMVNGLASNTMYYLCMRAETRAGPGALTDVITLSIPAISVKNHTYLPPVIEEEFQDPRIGIIVGVSIGVCCIVICALIILCRNRCFPPPIDHPHLHTRHWVGNGYLPHANGNGNISREYRISSSESHEMDSITPMLTNIPDTISSHLDTKGGYPVNPPYVNGVAGYINSVGRPANGHDGHQLLINITENPQFDMKSNSCTQGDNTKRKPRSDLRGSPSSSVPLLDRSSEHTSGSSENNAPNNSVVAQSQATGNHHHARDEQQQQQERNGLKSQGNGNHHHHHHHHHHANNNKCHQAHNNQRHHHMHGTKRNKRSSVSSSIGGCCSSSGNSNGGGCGGSCNLPTTSSSTPFLPSSSSSSTSLAHVHGSTPKDESSSPSNNPSSAITTVTITTTNGCSKHASKDGRRRRPLSHTAISATPATTTRLSSSSPKVEARHSSNGCMTLTNGLGSVGGINNNNSSSGGGRQNTDLQYSSSSSNLSSSSSPTQQQQSQSIAANSHTNLAPT